MESMLVASPSWYCSRVSDSNRSGIFCFAARNFLYMVDIASKPPKVKGHFQVHQDRVTGLRLQSAADAEDDGGSLQCCTTSEDRKVKIWKLESQAVVDSHAYHKQTPTTIDWSTADSDLIVSAADRGELVIWRPSKRTHLTYCPESSHVFCLACSPHDAKLVAVGYKTGLILVLDISKQGAIAHRLRGVDDEVHSLSWCPVQENIFQNLSKNVDDSSDNIFLASGSRDATVRVWNCQRERTLHVLRLPSSRAHRRERSEEFARPRVWVTLHWPANKPHRLLSSGHNGDLLMWDLTESRPKSTLFSVGTTKQGHTRIVFNISLGGPDLATVCTISMDRQIVLWSMETLSSMQCISSLGGFAYCVQRSPVNPGCLAVGTGDNMIRLWHVDRASQPYECQVLWQGIKSKVTSLSWHPLREGLLAYGTDDGRVGIYDVLSNRPPQLSSTYHKRTVYVVAWGPSLAKAGPVESSPQALTIPDTVSVSGLPSNITAEQLAEYFSSAGAVKIDRKKNRPQVWIYKDKETGKPTGDATVSYVDPASSVAAVEQLNGAEFLENVIKVEQATKSQDLPARTDGYVVYSVGDGAILQHDPRKLDGHAVNFNHLTDYGSCKPSKPPGRSEMCWSPDFGAVAIGNDDGSTEVWLKPSPGSGKFRLLCQISVHHKLLNALAWHPQYTAESNTESTCHHWLASGGNEHVVHVFDLNNVLASSAAIDSSQPVVITESLRQLQGHSNRITGLAWSIHVEGRLASASYDGTAQIWNAKTGEALINYRGHSGRLLTILWSALDADLLYTGGDDFTVQAWRPSQQTHVTPPAAADKKKHKRGGKTHSAATAGSKSKEPVAVAIEEIQPSDLGAVGDAQMQEIQGLLEQKKAELMQQQQQQQPGGADTSPPSASLPDEASGDAVEDFEETSDLLDDPDRQSLLPASASMKKDGKDKARKRRPKSLLPTANAQDNRGKAAIQQDCVLLTKLLQQGPQQQKEISDEDNSHLAIFLNRRAVYSMVKQEVESHQSRGHTEQELMLDVFQGSISDSLTRAAEAGQLTDWHLALASMASTSLWQKLCAVYSQQLEAEGHIHKASTYLLAAHQVEQAVELLCKHHLFRDALCLAQLRLSKHDPILQDIYKRWGDNLSRSGLYEMAARCYVALGQPVETARLLARRPDRSALRAATEVCLTAGELDQAVTYAQKYVAQCQQHWQWDEARELANQHQRFKLFALTTCVHHTLTSLLKDMGLLAEEERSQQCQEPPAAAAAAETGCGLRTRCRKSSVELLPRILLAEEDNDPLTPWQPRLVDDEAFIHHIVRLWQEEHGLTLCKPELTELKSQLMALRQAAQAQTTTRQVLCQVTVDICLGLVQLLLGRTEMAANAWLVALATCYDTEQKAIAEGLCRLLFPQGPDSINKLQNETIALRVATGGGTATLNHPKSAQLTTKPTDVCSISDHCTTMDSLRAFYYYTVLDYVVGQRCLKGQGQVSDAEETQNQSEATTEDRHKTIGWTKELELTESKLCKLAQMLLWDSLGEKSRLTETANQINRAVASMVNLHKQETKAMKPDDIKEEDEGLAGEQANAPPRLFRQRCYSGEYVSMKCSPTRRLSLDIPKPKPHEEIPMSPCVFEKTMLSRMESCAADYVQMFPESHECSELCSHDPSTPCFYQTFDNDDDDDVEKDGEEKVPPKFDLEPDSDSESKDLGVPDANGVANAVDPPTSVEEADKTERRKSGSSIGSSSSLRGSFPSGPLPGKRTWGRPGSVVIYEGVPDDWYTLPVDVKYQQDYVTLLVLMEEQSRAVGKLHEKQHLQAILFPDPVKSARLLLEVANKAAGENSAENAESADSGHTKPESLHPVLHRIALWASTYACLKDDKEYFQKQAEKYANNFDVDA